mmetsp:Transcript_122900/g.223338  ORF Transcript_122900/g.223338 Transcript_122900/m.223338 type:complete len:287 (-) Transcript_122900:46-906(-)
MPPGLRIRKTSSQLLSGFIACSMAEEPVVLFEKHGHIAVFTLNRPKAMNAISGAVSEQFEAHLETFEADDELWIGIVESSHPKTFCAGADLKSLNKGENVQTMKGGFAGMVAFPRKKPLIAAVDGNALAGGCEIVLACDMVVASKKAVFGVPEVKRSLIPGAGGLFRLPQKIPRAIAMELMLTGDPISCERAYQVGLVNHIAEEGRENVMKAAMALAERITVNAPLAVREAKACVDEFGQAALKDEDAFNRSVQGMGMVMQTPDFMEGTGAFIQKRAPKWTGKSKL